MFIPRYDWEPVFSCNSSSQITLVQTLYFGTFTFCSWHYVNSSCSKYWFHGNNHTIYSIMHSFQHELLHPDLLHNHHDKWLGSVRLRSGSGALKRRHEEFLHKWQWFICSLLHDSADHLGCILFYCYRHQLHGIQGIQRHGLWLNGDARGQCIRRHDERH